MQAPDLLARGQHVSEESEQYSSDATEENNDIDDNFQERDWFTGNNKDERDLFDETFLDDNFSEELENSERGIVNLKQSRGYVGTDDIILFYPIMPSGMFIFWINNFSHFRFRFIKNNMFLFNSFSHRLTFQFLQIFLGFLVMSRHDLNYFLC